MTALVMPLTQQASASDSGAPAALVGVLSVGAKPASLPATGGTVAVSGTVEHATRCQLQLLSSQSLPVVYSHDTKGCAGGGYTARVTVGPNTIALEHCTKNPSRHRAELELVRVRDDRRP